MGRPKGSKKNPFDALSAEWRQEVDAMGNDEEAVRAAVARLALNESALREAEKADEDLAQKKEVVKIAMEPYSSVYKTNKLKMRYLRAHLESNGKDSGDAGLEDREGEE